MEKTKRVAIAEYSNAVRSKVFILSVLMAPALMALSVGIQFFAEKKVDTSPRKFAVVDRSGKIYPALKAAAKAQNEAVKNPGKDKLANFVGPKAPFIPSTHQDQEDEEKLILELSNQVRKKKLFAFLIIGKDVMETDGEGDRGIRYYSQTPSYFALPNWIDRTVNGVIRNQRFKAEGLDTRRIAKLNRRVGVDQLGLAKRSKTGKVQKAKKDNKFVNFLVPVFSMMVMFMIVMTSAPMLMNTVLEEKMNKVSEVLISSVSPFQLMFGKLVGCVLVALTLSLLYIGGIAGVMTFFGVLELLPWSLIVWFFVYQILALFIFGSMFLAIGSACNEIRDAQSLMMPAMILGMVPMFAVTALIRAPHSPFSQAMSLIPPFTPTLMIMRLAAAPGPATWELVLGFVLTTAFMFFCVWAAARIFRIGILAQGQSPTMAKLISWLWSK